jgi:hypothetical protein
MDNKRKNLIIMVAPIILPAAFCLVVLGESILFFLLPLVVHLCIAIGLAKRLNTKEAIIYPIVQYPFLLLLLGLFSTVNPGFGFILILPITFIVNSGIGYLYFRFVKSKNWYIHVLVLLLTLIITIALYSNDNGKSMFSIIFDKLLS